MNNNMNNPSTNQPFLPPYKEPNYNINYLLSIIESFFLTLIAELGDKTFVMLIILQLRANQVTILYSAIFAELIMNITAIFFGYFIDYLLYKNLIDYLGILLFITYGIFLLGNTRKKEDLEMYEKELLLVEEINENLGDYDINDKDYQILLENTVPDKNDSSSPSPEDDHKNYEIQKLKAMSRKAPLAENLDIIPESEDISREDTLNVNSNLMRNSSMNNNKRGSVTLDIEKLKNNVDNEPSDDNNNGEKGNNNIDNENKNDIDQKNYNEVLLRKVKKKIKGENIDFSVFWTIFSSMILAEFGDRTQIFSFTMSSIFNLSGVLIGSCLALFCSCVLGVYFGNKILKKISVSVFDFILGSLLLIYGIQIFIGKKRSGQ